MDSPNTDSQSALIEIRPMHQRSEILDQQEDWTGKNSTALRRKLQNRLNQRASRKRRNKNPSTESTSTINNEETHAAPVLSFILPSSPTTNILRRSKSHPPICMQPFQRQSITAVQSFNAFMPDFNYSAISGDHHLLTLLYFNLVRALNLNVLALGVNPEEMGQDIISPFCNLSLEDNASGEENEKKIDISKLHPNLQPTELQLTVPHHPEIDIFPFPEVRDNFIKAILAGKEIDDVELCWDLLYGVEGDGMGGRDGRTGLIVWDEPWLMGSWEVEEEFARKYGWLLEGCEELIESTNFWRRKRGEGDLVL